MFRRLAALFGVVSCIACLVITLSILFWGEILLSERSVPMLLLEVAIGVTGTSLNLRVLINPEAEG